MARRFPLGVVEVFIYRSQIGFRYNGRNEEGRIIYEKTQDFRSRFDVKREVMKRWPKARITYSRILRQRRNWYATRAVDWRRLSVTTQQLSTDRGW